MNRMKRFVFFTALTAIATGGATGETDEAQASRYALAPAVLGCGQGRTPSDVQDAILRGKDIACIMAKTLLQDPVELAKACEITDKLEPLIPIIRGLVGVRDAARRSGVTFQSQAEADAGAQ